MNDFFERRRRPVPPALRRTVIAALVALAGCSSVARIVVRPFYEPAELASEDGEVLRDLPYRTDPQAHPTKHRLDFYRPRGKGWPLLVFVHGGGLVNGDKSLEVGGFDIYANVGRFYASRDIGAAVINYRLQPEVSWPAQADDVAAAIAWAVRHGPEYGSDGRVFVSGHSAGAWLAARVALDRQRLSRFGIGPDDISGVIAISGSGYDLADPSTWEMYPREDWWARRFDLGDPSLDWHEAASVVPLIDGPGPPFLLIYSTHEWKALGRQNHLLDDALRRAGVDSELQALPSDGHRRMVLMMSRADRPVSAWILDFIHAKS